MFGLSFQHAGYTDAMRISTLAQISPDARIGANVSVGPFTVIDANVEIGENTSIGSHCAIGVPTPLADGRALVIGPNSTIRSHNILYEGSSFGAGLVTGHQVSVREKLDAGIDLQLGTSADVQGHAVFGDHVRIYNGAHIARGSLIGSFVWIFPYVAFTNDPHPPSDVAQVGPIVEDFAVIGTRATILPGVRVGVDSLVGAASLVTKDVEPGTFVSGVPAKRVALAKYVALRDGSGPAYPWRRHFHRGFPANVVENWVAEFLPDLAVGGDRAE
jgi:acetyltransferase-like isoleucine patch superfamily enzyme